jgi:hypothetical protein
MRSLRPRFEITAIADGALMRVIRGSHVEQKFRLGPNQVHAAITHADGSITDLGISHNLLITASAGGRDHASAALGGLLATGGQGSPATSTSATSFTATATPWTTNLLAGMQAVFPVTGITTAPVIGRIISNTNAVATIDKWSNPDDTTGTTPAATNAFIILPGGAPARYMALTENASAASAADTVLTGEIATGGCGRALATYAHTLASATYTLQKAFSVTGTFPAIHKMGIFLFSTVSGVLFFESVLNADASVVNGDTLTVTDTVTVS